MSLLRNELKDGSLDILRLWGLFSKSSKSTRLPSLLIWGRPKNPILTSHPINSLKAFQSSISLHEAGRDLDIWRLSKATESTRLASPWKSWIYETWTSCFKFTKGLTWDRVKRQFPQKSSLLKQLKVKQTRLPSHGGDYTCWERKVSWSKTIPRC